jgi:hypothetical protein
MSKLGVNELRERSKTVPVNPSMVTEGMAKALENDSRVRAHTDYYAVDEELSDAVGEDGFASWDWDHPDHNASMLDLLSRTLSRGNSMLSVLSRHGSVAVMKAIGEEEEGGVGGTTGSILGGGTGSFVLGRGKEGKRNTANAIQSGSFLLRLAAQNAAAMNSDKNDAAGGGRGAVASAVLSDLHAVVAEDARAAGEVFELMEHGQFDSLYAVQCSETFTLHHHTDQCFISPC